MNNFWLLLPRPILTLAPMADVTDAAYRFIIAKYGKPDVMYTEFVSADGLVMAPEEGRRKLLKHLEYSKIERPIIAQFFTSNPKNMERASRLAVELGFDGVDINMGCPDRSVEKQGAGAALIKNPKLAQELIFAAKEQTKIPVSVKTRLGYNEDELEEWLPQLLEAEPAAITIHARTRKEMSKVPARWGRIARAVEIRNELKSTSLILGNGDLTCVQDALEKCRETGADGAMLGRAIFGKPWLFSRQNLTIDEVTKVVVEHTKLFESIFKEYKNFSIMKKHLKAYTNGLDRAAELRSLLMSSNNAKDVEKIIDSWNSL